MSYLCVPLLQSRSILARVSAATWAQLSSAFPSPRLTTLLIPILDILDTVDTVDVQIILETVDTVDVTRYT